MLFGSVSGHERSQKASIALASDRDHGTAEFADVNRSYSDLKRYMMDTSGGEEKFDAFIHSTVPSTTIQSRLLSLYRPIAATFYGKYARVWGSQYKRLSTQVKVSDHEISHWTSVAMALQLVRQAELALGWRYDRIYLTRPDLQLWRGIDIRRYCPDRIYQNNGFPPYFPGRGAIADFHFVMNSSSAEAFSHIAEHFAEFEFGAHNWGGRPGVGEFSGKAQDMMAAFVKQYVGVPLVPDHIVPGRHEAVSRKVKQSVRARTTAQLRQSKCRAPGVLEA